MLTHAIKIACKEWGWMSANPMTGLERPQDSEARTRLPSSDEISRLLTELAYDPGKPPANKSERIGWAMVFAIETAMRAGEMVKLKWRDVHLDQRIVSIPVQTVGKNKGKADTKTGAARDVPLSKTAVAILQTLATVKNEDATSVFELGSGTLDTLFRRARDACQIDNLHWHDLRAEALTRMAKKVPVVALARISGHKNLSELMTYYRETPTEIADMLG